MTMPTIILEGQEISLSAEQCQTDEILKNTLLPFYPAIAGAEIKRETVGGEERISLVKGVGTKGNQIVFF